MDKKKQVILIVLDGWGHREEVEHNAIAQAKTPFFDHLWGTYPRTLLEASGEAVGLPEGQMGNSEIGHTVLGSGKVVYTDLVKISKSVKDETLSDNEVIKTLFDHVKKHNSVLHLKGLLSDGGVHSHHDHLLGIIMAAKKSGIDKIAIHAFADGRDTPPQSANRYLEELENYLEEIGIGFIATVTGRFYAMDRDNNWDRLKKAEDAIFHGTGNRLANAKPSQIVAELYQKNIIDEHIEPIVFLDANGKSYTISENDGVIFFNFRKDRARMLSQKTIERAKKQNICFATMTQYDKNLDCLVVFPPEEIETTLSKEISEAGLEQVHIAETEKFAHATYYLNGGKQEPHEGEKHVLVESRKDISTHDQAPEMRAEEITKKAFDFIEKNTDFIFINYANPDMVGHTGNPEALIKSIEIVDRELEKITKRALKNGADIIITADHGNAETTFDKSSGQAHTAHTTSQVPFLYVSHGNEKAKLKKGSLSDVAPTILHLFNLKKPSAMTGSSLFK